MVQKGFSFFPPPYIRDLIIVLISVSSQYKKVGGYAADAYPPIVLFLLNYHLSETLVFFPDHEKLISLFRLNFLSTAPLRISQIPDLPIPA